MTRPSYSGLPRNINFGQTITISANLPAGTVTVALMDLGFNTHGVTCT